MSQQLHWVTVRRISPRTNKCFREIKYKRPVDEKSITSLFLGHGVYVSFTVLSNGKVKVACTSSQGVLVDPVRTTKKRARQIYAELREFANADA